MSTRIKSHQGIRKGFKAQGVCHESLGGSDGAHGYNRVEKGNNFGGQKLHGILHNALRFQNHILQVLLNKRASKIMTSTPTQFQLCKNVEFDNCNSKTP
jgi:hypothetical protein